MNKQKQMIKALKAKGIDPSEPVPDKEWEAVRLSPQVRTRAEVVRDGVKQKKAVVYRTVRLKQVSVSKKQANLQQCALNECGSFGVTESGQMVCWRCTCKGPELETKAGTVGEECPHEPALWSNKNA